MLLTSYALNLRSGLFFQLANIDCPLGHVLDHLGLSCRQTLASTRKIVISAFEYIHFNPALLNKEQDHGAF